MIEIGKSRTVIVKRRDKTTGKLTPAYGPGDIPETKIVANEVWRVTRKELDGTFGTDRNRKIVVGLIHGDLLVMRPQGTRRKYTASLINVLHWMIRNEALKQQLEKARAKKESKQRQRASRRLDYAERKLRQPMEAE